ncbi:MAG: AmmeMemoRadiSam system protein B [Bacteroidetes bacterium GWF2_40_14]|nr:MAG: AmmeMemoRadiSam system protein B [Bacteroidetes bacterium GWF2_40_14]
MDRQPAVAGSFYPADKQKLHKELENIFASAIPKRCSNVRAIICPHAGYIYSGEVAASAFNQIDTDIAYKRIFVIASSHQEWFEGAAVYCDGDFIMPFGTVPVDRSFGKMLVERFPVLFTSDRGPHQKEHSLEVQLPFLNHILKSEYSIVPIIIGTSDKDICKEIALTLKPYFTPENLFIISSDFSHYPNYADAQKVDDITKEAILANNPDVLLASIKKTAEKKIPHLVTSLCGWTSVLTLLYMTSNEKSLEYIAVDYRNSGDVEYYGETNRVVGYWGIAVCGKQPPH